MNGEIIDEIKLSSYIVIEKVFRLFDKDVDYEGGIRPCFKYIDDCLSINRFCDEINIKFISDFRDITFSHYMNQPMSKLTRKLIINLLQNQSGDYNHEWLPNCFIFIYIPMDE